MQHTVSSAGSGVRRRRRLTANAVIVCCVAFLALTFAAMASFPGGARFVPGADGYLFFDNYFSDLGGTHTPSGRTNDAARPLFTVALVLVGVSLCAFGPAAKAWAPRGRAVVTGALGTLCAVASGIGFVAVALTPWNRDYMTHHAYVRASFGALAAFLVLLVVSQHATRAPKRWVAANVVCLAVIAGYGLAQLLASDVPTRSEFQFQVGVQKLVVYTSMANLALQAWAIRSRTAPPAASAP